MDAGALPDVQRDADGQVVWSWSPDAGIKPRVKRPGRRRLTSPALRREREAAVKPLRRECRAISALPDDLWAFFLSAHEDCGCGRAPGTPCALSLERDTELQDPDAICAAGMRRCALTPSSFRDAATCPPKGVARRWKRRARNP